MKEYLVYKKEKSKVEKKEKKEGFFKTMWGYM